MWKWPLKTYPEIPMGAHPGAFGTKRKFDIHTGVDLYCNPGDEVFAVEYGKVVEVEDFTGANAESPWWNDTQAVLVEGESGVVLYGEIEAKVSKNDLINKSQLIGNVKTVLKKDKGKPMTMLHFELYKKGTVESVWWHEEKPDNLLNPTKNLYDAYNGYVLTNEFVKKNIKSLWTHKKYGGIWKIISRELKDNYLVELTLEDLRGSNKLFNHIQKWTCKEKDSFEPIFYSMCRCMNIS